ncbi:hypothetical protein [Colwellia sp. Bg11-12]|uniref:hypothetical protein n=1 Tax=Colwellia sp. Bg11-12 TaxID=2759817 RepID=UPI0015F47D53|nr:hypothetical protein [Colwellia sp. Bg11-12]MBA6265591.1 hypothetical protein [Colwellia sp. Bg11-12]
MIKKLLGILLCVLLSSCTSNQGYDGEKRPKSELATIYAAKIQRYGFGNSQALGIAQVNGIEVGDPFKGYPRKVYVLPGTVTIKFKFGTLTLGQAIERGLIPGSTSNNNVKSKGEFKFTVEKGKSYRLHFKSEAHTFEDLTVWTEPYK